MSGILNYSINTIAQTGNIMFYLGTGAVLLSILYMLVWASAYWSGIGKDNTGNESYPNSAKKLLPVFIRNGFLMVFSGLTIGTILLFLEWNKALLLLPVVLFISGLIVLFLAWHIRQGLLYVGFFRLAFGLLNMPRSVHSLFLFQLLFWIVLFVCRINPVLISPVHQSIAIAGCTLLIAILSIVFMLKLKKIKK